MKDNQISKAAKTDPFLVIFKLKNILKCKDYRALARKLFTDESQISRVKNGQEAISPTLFLRAAIVLDLTPNELGEKVGLPADHFLFPRR